MRRDRTIATIAGAVSVALLIAFAVYAPRQAAAGWLIAFVSIGGLPLGALVLIMIHNLTGGSWGEALRPTLEPAATCAVLLAPFFIPIVVALPLLYPWALGSPQTPPDVAALYLNAPLFVLRAVIALAGWTALSLLLPNVTGRQSVLLSGAGLIFHAVAVTLLSTDWVFSTEPAFISNSFGATTAFVQLYTALAFTAIVFAWRLPRQATRDLAGLMLAVALGITYIGFIAVLVIWYGNLPPKAVWFVERIAAPWNVVAIGMFVIGSVVPVLALLLARVRESPRGLQWIGAAALVGIGLYNAWLLAPPYGVGALFAAVLSAVTMAAALWMFATHRRDVWRLASGARHG